MRPVSYFICCLHCTFDVYVWCVISIAIFAVQSFARAAFKVCLCFYLRTTKLVTLFSIQTVNAILLWFIHHFRWPIPRFFVQNPSVGWMRVYIRVLYRCYRCAHSTICLYWSYSPLAMRWCIQCTFPDVLSYYSVIVSMQLFISATIQAIYKVYWIYIKIFQIRVSSPTEDKPRIYGIDNNAPQFNVFYQRKSEYSILFYFDRW